MTFDLWHPQPPEAFSTPGLKIVEGYPVGYSWDKADHIWDGEHLWYIEKLLTGWLNQFAIIDSQQKERSYLFGTTEQVTCVHKDGRNVKYHKFNVRLQALVQEINIDEEGIIDRGECVAISLECDIPEIQRRMGKPAAWNYQHPLHPAGQKLINPFIQKGFFLPRRGEWEELIKMGVQQNKDIGDELCCGATLPEGWSLEMAGENKYANNLGGYLIDSRGLIRAVVYYSCDPLYSRPIPVQKARIAANRRIRTRSNEIEIGDTTIGMASARTMSRTSFVDDFVYSVAAVLPASGTKEQLEDQVAEWLHQNYPRHGGVVSYWEADIPLDRSIVTMPRLPQWEEETWQSLIKLGILPVEYSDRGTEYLVKLPDGWRTESSIPQPNEMVVYNKIFDNKNRLRVSFGNSDWYSCQYINLYRFLKSKSTPLPDYRWKNTIEDTNHKVYFEIVGDVETVESATKAWFETNYPLYADPLAYWD